MTWDKDWYHNRGGKESIARRRRNRYKTDPAYRALQKKRARDHYKQKKKKLSPVDRTVVRADSGRYLTIGRAAAAINRKVQTVRMYHKNGVFPEAKFFDSRGWRLYTADQVGMLRDQFQRLDSGELSSLAELSRVVKSLW